MTSTQFTAVWKSLYQHTTYRPIYDSLFIVLLLLWECILCGLIIHYVSYTEIDFSTYMEQVTVYLHGERDYINIRGATGPCVYPAGHLYLYSLIQRWTDNGTNVRQAQYIFAFFYVVTQALVLYIYHATLIGAIRYHIIDSEEKTTSALHAKDDSLWKKKQFGYLLWCSRCMMAFLCFSKRLHSIFMLRLFNDGPTMMFLYASIVSFIHNYWNIGCILFSLGVSIKMNVLLFAPGLFLLLLQVSDDFYHVIFRLFFYCAVPQLILGAPFLLSHPVHYLRKAFELDRSFFYQWTVNWKVGRNRATLNGYRHRNLTFLVLSSLNVLRWQ
jgi:alpha-1,3-mannosyltransferase